MTFKDIQRADTDWPKWLVPICVALVLIGGAFQWSGHNPLVAILGLCLVLAVALPLRARQLRRRLAAAEALKSAEAVKVDKPASPS